MAQGNPRQHHFIPKFLLENFTDEEGYLWAVYRPTRKVFRTTPQNLFKERDLYASHEIYPSSELQYSTDYATREEELSKLEGIAAPVVGKIITSARQEQPPALSDEENRIFMEFFLTIYRRTPIMLKQIGADFTDVFYQAASMRAAETGYALPTKDDLYQNLDIIKLINLSEQNSKSRFAVGDHKILRDKDEAAMRDAGLLIISILSPKRSFIIGDCAFSIKQHGKPEPNLLPIASDTVVGLINNPGQILLGTVYPDNRSDEKINAINVGSVTRSNTFAGRSETLVRSLMNRIG